MTSTTLSSTSSRLTCSGLQESGLSQCRPSPSRNRSPKTPRVHPDLRRRTRKHPCEGPRRSCACGPAFLNRRGDASRCHPRDLREPRHPRTAARPTTTAGAVARAIWSACVHSRAGPRARDWLCRRCRHARPNPRAPHHVRNLATKRTAVDIDMTRAVPTVDLSNSSGSASALVNAAAALTRGDRTSSTLGARMGLLVRPPQPVH